MSIAPADQVLAELVAIDHDYEQYGPNLSRWGKSVRGEYFDRLHSCTERATHSEHLPVHPRKSSAGRRRRHLTQLAWRLRKIAPGAETILLTPIWTDALGDPEVVFMATVRDGKSAQVRLPRGGSRRIAALVQGAHPSANWERAQTWHASTGELTEWHPAPPSRDFADSRDRGYVERLGGFEKRLTRKATS
jgi:hypothetical protein